MNVLVLGLANNPGAIAGTPLRDACVLVFLFAGIVLLLAGAYLLFARAGETAYPSDPARTDR